MEQKRKKGKDEKENVRTFTFFLHAYQQKLLFPVIRFVTDEAGGKSGETSFQFFLSETGELGTRNYDENPVRIA